MTPANIKFKNKADKPCDVHGSYVKNGHYLEIYSFEGCFMYKVYRTKIIDKININLNK